MRTTRFWHQFLIATTLGVCYGCTITSAQPDSGSNGSGGASSTGGSGSGGSGSGGSGSGSGGSMGTGGTPDSHTLPCDVYAADGGPCVAAHSTVRLLTKNYTGALYQVRKTTDGTTMDIGVVDGFANSADQDSFCGVDACTISIIYDQSGKGNNLTRSPAGMAKMSPNDEANAKALPVTFAGHKVYGLHIAPQIGYRNNAPTGTATGDDPETEYMVVAGDFYNGACCFDYGNMETTSRDDGEGTMEAVYFGNCTIWNKGGGNGPWIMGDLENGLWAGDYSPFDGNASVTFKYITGMVKGDLAGKNHWTIKIGDAQSGGLKTPFDGKRPSARYNPMRKQGAIGLGTGGDNSSGARGNFFEGVMTHAYSSGGADDSVQANIVSVYGQP